MHYKSLLYFLSIFYIWNFHYFAQSTINSQFNLASDEYSTCDYSRFESQLEALNEMIQLRLNKQSEILQRFEKKFDSIGMISEIKDIMKEHDVLFKSFGEKLKNVENILNKSSWETNKLDDSISKNLPLLQNIEMKLTNVDTITMEQNRNIEEYLNKTEATKICLKTDDQILVCTNQSYPTSCADFNTNHCANNKCRIHNQLYGPQPFWVACDNHTEDGGWTVIQRRINGSVDFYRGWSDYKQGFGSIDGEFFIGLDKLHALTTTLQPMELLIQLQDFNDTATYAKYDEFVIGNETEKYKLNKVGIYSGNAGDAFSLHQGFYFTTKDRDNDHHTSNCAVKEKGAWWYSKCFWSTTQSYPTSCAEFNTYHCANNKCRIHNQLYEPQPFWVACDGHTEGGGWTVIQRRINGSVDFYRDWSEYKNGFGSIDGEFFIGLDKLHALTTTLQPMELLIQLRDFNDTATYAKYDEFVIGNETENYILSKVGKYSGNATDAFSQHQGFKFTTRDRDNDIDDEHNCAKSCQGAWWYRRCFFSNLNGKYYDNQEMAKNKFGICWKDCDYTLNYVQMMIRPKKKLY